MPKKENKFHFTQVFKLNIKEKNLDFFDVNLKFDTPLFIDPFLLKNSRVKDERKLFDRFGIFFNHAIKQLHKYNFENEIEKEYFLNYITFGECKSLYLGYTASSNKGKGPGKSFAKDLFNFFIDTSLRKVLEDQELYPLNKMNPLVLSLLAKNIGPDSISDLSGSLVLDYLISYTQFICKKYKIPRKELPVPKHFNFTKKEWMDGYALLPENPFNKQSIILVPKRLLRGYDIIFDRNIALNLQQALELDPVLKFKFSEFIEKNVTDIKPEEIHFILKQNLHLIKDIINKLEINNPGEYDFVKDPYKLLAIKNYYYKFDKKFKLDNCESLIRFFLEFLDFFQKYILHHGGWKELWIKVNGVFKKECNEDAVGRLFYAMGLSWFRNNNEIMFLNEVSRGDGFVDFFIAYKECNVVIELKKLSNSQPTGKTKEPAYLHGCIKQLPEYAIQHNSKFAVYITIQHQKSIEKGKANHDYRINEIEKTIEQVEKYLKKEIKNFECLHCVECTPKFGHLFPHKAAMV